MFRLTVDACAVAVSCSVPLWTCVLFHVPFDFGRACCFVFRSTLDVCAVSCSVRLWTCVLFRVPFHFGPVCCFMFHSTLGVRTVSCFVPLWTCVLFDVPFDFERACCFVAVPLWTFVLFDVPFDCGRACYFVSRSTLDVCAVACSVRLYYCSLAGTKQKLLKTTGWGFAGIIFIFEIKHNANFLLMIINKYI